MEQERVMIGQSAERDYGSDIRVAPRGRTWTREHRQVVAAAFRERALDNFEAFCLRQESRVINRLAGVGVSEDEELIAVPIGCRKADLELVECRK
jgi:hypothetical protein